MMDLSPFCREGLSPSHFKGLERVIRRLGSPCTVNGPSSSHCKGPEVLQAGKDWVHPTLMGLRELFIVWGPLNLKGLSSSQHNGPDGNIVGYGGSSSIKRLKWIGVHGTWHGHFKLTLSQLKGLAKTSGSFNPIWTCLFWLNLGTLEILFVFHEGVKHSCIYRCSPVSYTHLTLPTILLV